jgi:perosamine synthetase
MEHIERFGDHNIYQYDTKTHQFLEFFKDLYKTEELDKLTLGETAFREENIHDVESAFHKIFYTEIKSNPRFKKLYCNFIRSIHQQFFPMEDYLIYQSFPSVRFQFINNITVPPHCDSDSLGCHPLGEKNFIIPITEMTRSKTLFIESEPGKKDFKGIDLKYGQLFYFNGNKCIHYNEKNVEDTIRISLDFRAITAKDYLAYLNGNITSTNPRDPEKTRKPTKILVGGYYQIVHKSQSLESMMDWHFQKSLLLQSQPNFDIAEAQACFDYMKDGTNFVTEYKKTSELERMICDFTGAKHAIMTTSGNTAIILALMAYDIKAGDEVIVPNYTMIATANSVKLLGATPVFADVSKESYTLSIEGIEKARTDKTRAVLHVSLNNRHSDIKAIAKYCEENNLILIEDAAQSLGCRVDGVHFGRFGKIGCFSLSTPKIISTGQGGFLITDDDSIASKLNIIKNFGRKTGGIDDFEVFGINAKFTDIQAVIGIEQMKKLPGRVIQMRKIFDLYYENLSTIMLPPKFDSWIPWFIDIFVPQRDKLADFLKKHDIQTRVTYPTITTTNMYKQTETYENTEFVSTNGLFLPSHTCLDERTISHICTLINLFVSASTESS